VTVGRVSERPDPVDKKIWDAWQAQHFLAIDGDETFAGNEAHPMWCVGDDQLIERIKALAN
jgi:hypothetical protein